MGHLATSLVNLSSAPSIKGCYCHGYNRLRELKKHACSYIEKLIDLVLIKVAVDTFHVGEVLLADPESFHLGLDAFLVSYDSTAHYMSHNKLLLQI